MAMYPPADQLSDAALDFAYDAAMISHNFAVASEAQAEISRRLQSVWSFVSGAFGGSRFPKYDAWMERGGSFSQSAAAQASVAGAVKQVRATVGAAVADVAAGTAGAVGDAAMAAVKPLLPVLVIGLVAVVLAASLTKGR